MQTEQVEQHEDAEENKEIHKENGKSDRFTQGEVIKLVRVRFPGNAKSFPFLIGKRNFLYGQKVLAMSDRGMTVGYINSFPYEIPFDKSMLPLKSISKIATDEDVEEQKSFIAKERDAEKICIDLIEKYKLEMNITHVEFIQFGKKAVFYFNAPARIDFRELVKDLVGQLKMRIELRQISVRDRTAALGGVGACGLQTCCSSFLKNYGNAGIKMAKNQNLALVPSKINGICGQIKCCIKYEDHVYTEKRKQLPREGSFVLLKNGEKGKILKLDLLLQQFDMLSDEGHIRKYTHLFFDKKNSAPEKDWTFPKKFEHIYDERHTLLQFKDNEIDIKKEEIKTQDEVEKPIEAVPLQAEEKTDHEKSKNQKKRRNRNRNRNNKKPDSKDQ